MASYAEERLRRTEWLGAASQIVVRVRKPEARVRAVLKAHGYRWSPSRSAWVRKITDNARANLLGLLPQIAKCSV